MRVWLLLVVSACSFEARVAPGDSGTDTTLKDATDGPVMIDAPACGAEQIAAAGNHACVRRVDGNIYCWGSNNTYELGSVVATKCTIGSMMYPCSATPVPVVLPGTTALGLGNSHSCATASDGTYCWGFDKYGAFGDGSTATTAAPHLVPQRGLATSIGGGVYHTCSVAAGDVSCSGENVAGEIGNNTVGTMTTAVTVLSNATTVSLGEYISCAIDGQQQLSCWGHNNFYEIDGTAQNKLVPTPVTGIPMALAVAAGRDHLCAVAPDHTLVCRGSNAAGQLGTGALANVASVSAHHNHTCVIDTAGAVSCFGESYGATPVPIALPRPALQLASGVYFDCAITDDRAAYCWGDASFGELGNGVISGTRETTPQQVQLCM